MPDLHRYAAVNSYLLITGLMLATYWAARYFVPAVVSLWMAKQVRKRYYAVTAVVVMAANYAAFTAVLNRLLVGATTTVKLYYPLFSGNVTIPRVVAKWIRHNNHVAKFLTKTVSIPCFASAFKTPKATAHGCVLKCFTTPPEASP